MLGLEFFLNWINFVRFSGLYA